MLSVTVKLGLLDQDVSWTWLPLCTQLLLPRLWFLVPSWTRAVRHYHTWLSARPSAQKPVAKPADADRLSIWLQGTRESCSPPRGLLAGCVDIPLRHFSIKKGKKIATAGQALSQALAIYTG